MIVIDLGDNEISTDSSVTVVGHKSYIFGRVTLSGLKPLIGSASQMPSDH